MNRKAISDLVERLPDLRPEVIEKVGNLCEPVNRALLAQLIFSHINVAISDHFTFSELTTENCEEIVEFNWSMMDYMKVELNLDLDESRFCDLCLRTTYRAALRKRVIGL